MQHQQQQPRPRLLHAAFSLLGIPSFLLANSMWAEMAVLVRMLPEKDHTGSYLLVALQAANVFPALAMIESPQLHKYTRQVTLEGLIWLQLVAGFLVCQAISLLWDRTSAVGGQSHSVALIALVFLAGAVNNSSSLCLYPYVSRWPRRFITDLAVGEGLSGPLVSLIAAIQDVGGETPRFSTRAFYQLVSLLYLPALAAYIFLLRQDAQRKTAATAPLVATAGDATPPMELEVAAAADGYKRMPPDAGEEEEDGSEEGAAPAPAANGHRHTHGPAPAVGNGEEQAVVAAAVSPAAVFRRILPCLAVQFVVAGLAYGVLPALLPIAVTGYRDASHILQYSSLVSMCMDPAARFATHYVRVYRLGAMFLLVVALAAVIMAAAAASPHPPLAGLQGGGALIVLVNGAFTASFAFCSTMVYFATHRRLSSSMAPLEDAAGTGAGPAVAAAAAAAATALASGVEPLMLEDGSDRRLSSSRQEGREEVVVRLQRQQGFKQSAFAVQAGAFVGAFTTWLLVVFTKDRH